MRYFVIRTENLTKFYGHQRAIENITLEVEPGEVFGFLGPEGSGKTTFVRLLMDTIRPTRGNALVMGMDCHRQSREIRQKVGFVPPDLTLFKHMTIADYLVYLGRQRGPAAQANGFELMERFHLRPSRRIVLLTAEEKRKLGLVQAFMHQPDLLVFDEPTRGLPPDDANLFYRLIGDARNEGRSIFLSSKSLLEVERICDRVGVVHAGSLVGVERGVQLRTRAIRRVEMRFADPVSLDEFACLPNIEDARLEENKLFCTVHGEPDSLIKVASQHRVTDFISQQISLEEAFSAYYGIEDSPVAQ